MKKFHFYVIYQMKPGCRDDFVREMKESGVLQMIRDEDGCLQYEYFCAEEDPDRLLLIEEWENEEKQQIHVAQPHMSVVRGLKERFVDRVNLGPFELL